MIVDSFHQVARLFQALSIAGLGGVGALGVRNPCIEAKFLLDLKTVGSYPGGGGTFDCHFLFDSIDWLPSDLIAFGIACVFWSACLIEACYPFFHMQYLVSNKIPLDDAQVERLKASARRQRVWATVSALLTGLIVFDTFRKFEDFNVFAEVFVAASVVAWWLSRRMTGVLGRAAAFLRRGA